MPERIRRATAARMIAEIPNGQSFRVTFVKRSTGELRDMLCQQGVKAHLKGGDSAYDPTEHALLRVWSVDSQGYRSIPYEGLRFLKTGGQEYEIV